MKVLAAVALAGALIAACAQPPAEPGVVDSPEPSDEPVTTPVPSDPGSPSAPRPIEPRSGLVNVRPWPFARAHVLDERTVHLFFWGGNPECYGLARVDQRFRADAVVLTLYVGRDPDAQICTQEAVRLVTTVAVDEPLAGRKIVDGAR